MKLPEDLDGRPRFRISYPNHERRYHLHANASDSVGADCVLDALVHRSPPLLGCPSPPHPSASGPPRREPLRRSLGTCHDRELRLPPPERIPHARPPAIPRLASLPRLRPTANLIPPLFPLLSGEPLPGRPTAGPPPPEKPSDFSRTVPSLQRHAISLEMPHLWKAALSLWRCAISREMNCRSRDALSPGRQFVSVEMVCLCGDSLSLDRCAV
jgi:hypothetical protein